MPVVMSAAPMFAPLPEERFAIIYCDPPWAYADGILLPDQQVVEAAGQYQTMGYRDIMKLPVQSIAAENCLLFMWVSSPKLEEAMEVGKAWGFDFRTIAFIWHKQRAIMGYYTMSECEVCLVFKRGSIPQPRGERNVMQFVLERRTDHSVKPEEVRRRIDLMFPHHRKIELFARRQAEGWQVWGNEADVPDAPALF